MKHFSLLDLSPVPEGHTVADALHNSVRLAQEAELAGYHRFWLAEHHNMPGIASAATAVVIRYKPDELIVTGMMHDHAARLRSFDIAAGILKGLCA